MQCDWRLVAVEEAVGILEFAALGKAAKGCDLEVVSKNQQSLNRAKIRQVRGPFGTMRTSSPNASKILRSVSNLTAPRPDSNK